MHTTMGFRRCTRLTSCQMRSEAIADPPGESIGLVLPVVTGYAEQDGEPRADLSDDLAVHEHARLGHALDDGSHGAIIRGL